MPCANWGVWDVIVRRRRWWLHTTVEQRRQSFWNGFPVNPFTGVLNMSADGIEGWRVYFNEGEASEWWTELRSPREWAT